MLKPLTTIFRDHEVTLECTHKKIFPPPQMYGSTPEDIDTLWKQGTIDQNQYQQLKVWKDNCGLMVMGPRCLDCPLALKQKPRPGRPNVIETEPWLAEKERLHWADMKAGKLAPPQEEPKKGFVKKGTPAPVAVVEPEPEPEAPEETLPEDTMEDAPDEPSNEEVEEEEEEEEEESEEAPEPEKATLLDALQNPDEFLAEDAESEPEAAPESDEGLGDDILNALAED
jgi:hypothetical protein